MCGQPNKKRPKLHFCLRLQSFPLVHEIADFPHQRLVSVGDRFSGLEILVKPGRGHRGFEFLDLRFAFGDPRLQIGDALLKRISRALLLSALGFLALPRFAGFGIRDSGFDGSEFGIGLE